MALALETFALTLAAAGDTAKAEQAVRLLGAAAALRVELTCPLHPRWLPDIDAAVEATRAVLGEEGWQAAYLAGNALSLEEALAEALDEAEDEGHTALVDQAPQAQ
jgi:hypothetical protein